MSVKLAEEDDLILEGKCFMGKCIHSDPNDDDPCKDYEARSGIHGKCKEFKQWGKEAGEDD